MSSAERSGWVLFLRRLERCANRIGTRAGVSGSYRDLCRSALTPFFIVDAVLDFASYPVYTFAAILIFIHISYTP